MRGGWNVWIIVAILPCFGWATTNTFNNVEISTDGIGRQLLTFCEDGSKAVVHYFEVIVQIQPDAAVTGICTLADQDLILIGSYQVT